MSKSSSKTSSQNQDYINTWVRPSIRIGRITTGLAVFASFLPNLYLYLVHGVFPSWSLAFQGWFNAFVIFGAFYFVEPFSYYPILGLTGSYMGILSGNISNIRVPASAIAQEAVGVEIGSKQADIISTLGIAGSVVTNLIFLTASVLLGSSIMNIISPGVQNALESYVLPSIFGAIFVQFAISEVKIAAYTLLVSLVLVGLTSLPQWLCMIIAVFGNMLISRILYNEKVLK